MQGEGGHTQGAVPRAPCRDDGTTQPEAPRPEPGGRNTKHVGCTAATSSTPCQRPGEKARGKRVAAVRVLHDQLDAVAAATISWTRSLLRLRMSWLLRRRRAWRHA